MRAQVLGNEEALMSLTLTIVMLIAGWLAVATAMLWGVLRISRRHHHPVQSVDVEKPSESHEQHVTAH
ncbi:hypothetical protein GIW70_17340 [Pseudomonas syringae]|nr:hypothetical protein [Pseudomonas syringae]MCF5069953.1 hypothetical protein [Pseudomonas syringae]